jgi:hypothetical protein
VTRISAGSAWRSVAQVCNHREPENQCILLEGMLVGILSLGERGQFMDEARMAGESVDASIARGKLHLGSFYFHIRQPHGTRTQFTTYGFWGCRNCRIVGVHATELQCARGGVLDSVERMTLGPCLVSARTISVVT